MVGDFNMNAKFLDFLTLLGSSCLKTIIWFIWNVLFGLIIIGLIVFSEKFFNIVVDKKSLSEKIINDGIIIFFCSTLFAGASMDYILAKNIKKYYVKISLAIFSCLLLLINSIIFILLNVPHNIFPNYVLLYIYQNWLLFCCGLFVFVLKTRLFYLEK